MTHLYSEFLEAGKLVADIIGLKNVRIENKKHETPKIGVDYLSFFSARETRFNFLLRTECKKSDCNKWTTLWLSLYFYNEFDLCQFYRHEKFKPSRRVDVKQWASEVAHEYLKKKRNDDLDFLFGDRDIRVRGMAGVTNATLIEFIINLKGYLAWGADRLLVYRFHHGTGTDEGFSYAFFVESRHLIYDYSFWCVFPAFVGMSGGTGYGGYKQVESLLEETGRRLKLKIIDVRIEEDKFLEYLKEKNVRFNGLGDEIEQLMKEYTGTSSQAKAFLQRLEKCPPGKKTWKEYQDLVEEIFSYLFAPPLDSPKPQCRAEDGLEIRDMIFPNRVQEGFWEYVRTEYKGSYVVLEAKNKTKINKNDVLFLSDYLNEKQLGLFGVLVSRKTTDSALDQRRKIYSTDPHRMIVLLDDNDVRNMIVKKSKKENPEDVLKDRIDLYRISFRF
jgi:hypothetical protein